MNVDPSAVPAQYVDEKGRINLEIIVSDDNNEVYWNTTAIPAGHASPIGGGEEVCGPDVTIDCVPGDPIYIVPGAAGSGETQAIVVSTVNSQPVTPMWSTAGSEAKKVSLPQQLVVDLGAQPKIYDANNDPKTWLTSPQGAEVQPVPEDGDLPVQPTTPPDPVQLDTATANTVKSTELVARSDDFPAYGAAVEAGTITGAQILAGQVGAARNPPPCYTRKRESYNSRPEQYLAVYAYKNAPATIYQNVGSDHTLGVGYKATPTSGKWSANGTLSISYRTGSSQTVPNIIDAWVHGRVNYASFDTICPVRSRTSHLKPVSIADPIASYSYAPHQRWANCITLGKGAIWEKTTGRNITYASGVEVGGFSASAQSGYDSESKLSYTAKATSSLCGDPTTGVSRSRRVEARAWRGY